MRRLFASLVSKTAPILSPSVFSFEKQVLLFSKNTGRPFSLQSFKHFADLPNRIPQKTAIRHFNKAALFNEPWWYWKGGGWYPLSAVGWYGGLKSIAWRFRSQALESYCLWHGPLLKAAQHNRR